MKTLEEFERGRVQDKRDIQLRKKAEKITQQIYQLGFNNMTKPRIFEQLGVEKIA